MKKKKTLKEKFKRKERGITLIALVITIIVLLILAGVSIAMLTGENGILTQAEKANTNTSIAQEKEQIVLAYNGAKTENNGGDVDAVDLNRNFGYNDTKANATDEGNGTISVNFTDTNRTYTIDENGNISDPTTGTTPPTDENDFAGKHYDTDTDIEVEGKSITIPGGATVSGIDGENESVDDGFVIYITNDDKITDWDADTNLNEIKDVQETYDQFVWIPVEKAIVTEEEIGGDLENYITTNNVYPMAVKKADETYSGILYDFTEENGVLKITPYDYTTTSSNREPDVVGDDTGSYVSEGVTKTGLQAEYKEMIEGVESKEGFWVGRYETSNMKPDSTQDNTNVVKVVKGTTNGIGDVQWYRMYAQQKNYDDLKLTKSSNVKSSMIWGSQWDQIMIWMKDVPNKVNTTNGNYYITNSVGMGNFGNISEVDNGYSDTSDPTATGCFDVKNIYDLAGNVDDWTLEVTATTSRVNRRRLLHCYEYY